jgi:hypothetical protein
MHLGAIAARPRVPTLWDTQPTAERGRLIHVRENPFDSCWDRLDRVSNHRIALAEIWNEFIADHPYDFALVHEGAGVHVLEVRQTMPMPAAFALEFGEWLYNSRACLDYIVWATSAFVTGQLPPPNEGTLQYPIYESIAAWTNNEYRLKHLAPHHRQMLLHMQPFNSDPDANYLGAVNRLARIDRHRRLTISTAYLAEAEPVIAVPAGSRVSLQWGQRVLVDGHAQLARISVTPWADGTEVTVNPRVGIDPEVAEWAESKFWSRVRFTERLNMIQIFLAAEVAVYEYDCTGSSRKAGALTSSYREECDQRGPPGPIPAAGPTNVAWGPPSDGSTSSQTRFHGEDFPSGAVHPDAPKPRDDSTGN